MITIIKTHSRTWLTLLTFCSLIVTPSIAFTAEKAEETTGDLKTITKLKDVDQTSFEYKLEGRKDPFLPFLTPKVASSLDPNEIVNNNEKLTGMQVFEPGQLSLVAIMQIDEDFIAMVQDSTGRGYPVRKGTKIGRYGEIVNIDSNVVYIVETKLTRAQKNIETKIDMVLKKEGEE